MTKGLIWLALAMSIAARRMWQPPKSAGRLSCIFSWIAGAWRVTASKSPASMRPFTNNPATHRDIDVGAKWTMSIEGTIGAVNRVVNECSRAQILGVTLLGVIVVGIPDYLIGFEISLSIFYLGPVGIAAWYAGRRFGVLIALISTLTALAADFSAGHHIIRLGIVLWTGFLHLGFMLVVTVLLDRLHRHIENEKKLARLDPVTGIFNRRAFMEHLQYCLQIEAREGKPITLAYIDLDDFKRINDQYGHDKGDRVLCILASTLTGAVRRADVVARLGGDEFAVLLAGANRTNAERLITKMRHALQQAFEREQLAATCSIGCVTFQQPPRSADDAIKAADTLMYKVKNRSKNAVAFEDFDFQETCITVPQIASHRV